MQITKISQIDSDGKTKGCESAPSLVIDSLKELGCNEKGESIDIHRLNITEIAINPLDVNESYHNIFENSKEIFEKNFKSFFIGGDHSITYSIVQAFIKCEKNPLVIVFDSHLDCFKPEVIPDSTQWIRKLIEEGFNPSGIIFISTRNVWQEELEFIKKNKITIIKMDVLREEINEICDLVMERARNSSGFYISIDIDAVDPAFAPGANFPEVGGLSSRDLIYFVKRLAILENFKGADIVEINPLRDINYQTIKLGAKLLAEMI